MAIARRPYFVYDCPEPLKLAQFYGEILGWPADDSESGHWAEITNPADATHQIAFQRVDSYTPPRWPGQDVPQQLHLDVFVDDLDDAEAKVTGLGAVKHDHQPGKDFRVFLDLAGHTFCLCLDD